jgi:hypothetical protein
MPSSSRTPKRRLIRPATVIGVLFLLVVGIALLAIPFLKAPSHAAGAKSDLQAAKDSLTAGDFASAEFSVQSARRHADQVQDAMQGIGGDIWSILPVVGGPVSDVRHLGNALDHLTSVAETAVDAWPQINGDQATLFGDGQVDLPTLARLTASLDEVSKDLGTAEDELEQVGDERPFAGQQLASVRDDALDLVAPLGDGVDALAPVMDVLPGMLGANNERKYVIAMLNPSELRYSGGAVLALSLLTTEDGRFDVGDTLDTGESRAFFRRFYWLKVKGNPFHRGRQTFQTATYAPNWPVSGNELLNAFRSVRGRPGAGVIAVDSVALGRMLEFTGPITVPGYPTLTPDNFVFETVGNYIAYPDTEVRKRLNRSLAPAFTDALLDPRDVVDKLKAVHELAQARHFAVYFREPAPQAAFADLGLAGDLSDTEHDYLAVFSQNTNISKADFWQRRSVQSEVDLRPDGSASVRMSITVHNDSPPGVFDIYNQRGLSYTTPWNGMSLAAFLPMGAKLTSTRLDGKVVPFTPRQYYGRPFVRRTITFPPQSRKTYELRYDVPAAATVGDDGELTYRLDLTPQGMVTPQAVSVRVKFPKGLEVSAVPEGWGARGGRVATYDNPGLITQPSFSITASPAAADAP